MSRTTTPAALKWALNERAAVAGRIERLTESIEQSRLELAALDRTIGLLDAGVCPDALGSIRAWAGRYGERGALNAFLRQALQEAGTAGLTTVELAQAAARAFELDLVSSTDLRRFIRHSVGNRLRQWRAAGDIESFSRPGRTSPVACWRWKQGPTLADLIATDRRANGGQ